MHHRLSNLFLQSDEVQYIGNIFRINSGFNNQFVSCWNYIKQSITLSYKSSNSFETYSIDNTIYWRFYLSSNYSIIQSRDSGFLFLQFQKLFLIIQIDFCFISLPNRRNFLFHLNNRCFALLKTCFSSSISPSKSLACLSNDKQIGFWSKPDLTKGSIIEICFSNRSSVSIDVFIFTFISSICCSLCNCC